MTAKKIVVLSPHLDDAVLDCCDHILMWKRNCAQIMVLSVFTALSEKVSSPWTRWYVEASGSRSTYEFERARIREDTYAMNLLGVKWNRLGYIDVGFREKEGAPLYPDSDHIFSGIISPHDFLIMNELEQEIKALGSVGQFVVPLGVGKSIDHIIVRKAAERVLEPQDLSYYVDYPYALSYSNWTVDNAIKVIISKKSIKWMTKEKHKLLTTYSSQMPLLFGRVRSYPEIILYPKN
jgi:hypothetical protein